ncbi:acylphosphatase [Paenarthrobacter sp. NPDC090517]|uniref:acylphosphatase n=1 Tax=Paenarthrobacter sp. NPDC090517 TaxID=3364381 RepID=UPI00380EA79F
MTDETLRLTARITGVVQGVGFRYWTARKADELMLKGTVRNYHDGSVLLVAEGEASEVSQLTSWLHSTQAPGRVENVDFEVSEATGEFNDFRILG